jgi:hypothetical protein
MSNQKKFDLFYYLPSTNSGKRQGGINQRKNVRMPSMEVHNAPCHLFGRTRREYKKREKRERERERERVAMPTRKSNNTNNITCARR